MRTMRAVSLTACALASAMLAVAVWSFVKANTKRHETIYTIQSASGIVTLSLASPELETHRERMHLMARPGGLLSGSGALQGFVSGLDQAIERQQSRVDAYQRAGLGAVIAAVVILTLAVVRRPSPSGTVPNLASRLPQAKARNCRKCGNEFDTGVSCPKCGYPRPVDLEGV